MRQNQDERLNMILEDDMAKDTKYLSLINGTWHFDFTVPKILKKWFKQQRIRNSLNTSDYKQAKFIRDKYLVPVLGAENAIEILENISRFINIAELDLGKKSEELVSFINRRQLEEEQISLQELCQSFLKQYEKGSFVEASINKIQSGINSACGILGNNIAAETISKKDIIRYRDVLLSLPVGWQKKLYDGDNYDLSPALEDEKSMHPNTVKKHIQTLKRIFAWGITDCKLIRKDNPVDNIEILGLRRPAGKRPPEGNEVEQLCNLPMPISKNYDITAWEMLPIFARYTACRIGEISLLTSDDIIIKNGIRCLRITAHGNDKQLKTESSERLVPISDKLQPFLENLLKKQEKGPLFKHCGHWGKKQGRVVKAAHHFLKSYNTAAKKVAPDISFHCWRVYANTQMAEAEVDILDRESVLGHKSDRVQRVYTANNLERLQRAVNTIF